MRDRFSAYIARIVASFTRTGEGTREVRARAGAVPLPFPAVILLLSFLFIHLFSSAGWAFTPSGTIISNSAILTYTSSPSGSLVTAASNTAVVTSTVLPPQATIDFLIYAPSLASAQSTTVHPTLYSTTGAMGGPLVAEPLPTPVGSTTPLDLSKPVPLTPTTLYHAGEPIFISLTAKYLNNDPTTVETAMVTIKDSKTGDTETLQLTETGPNTGVFVGYVLSSSQAGNSGNGVLSVSEDSNLSVTFSDSADSLTVNASAMVDPFGIVFDSATGKPINGAKVTFVDASTNSPATVFGDDGVSIYPSNGLATVTTGGTAQDSSGRVYTFSAGGYRFPFINPGRYKLVVVPPAGYRWPSQVATAALQNLPGNPFAIVEPGSRGEVFIINPGPAIHIDIPIDPVGSRLYLIKSALKDSAAVGDFVPYTLHVENTDSAAPVPGVTITDRLPAGFRYQKGSARLNNSTVAEPVISQDGRSITFTIGDLAPAASADIAYVAEVGAGANPGTAINTAVAGGTTGAFSNTASASVKVTEDLFSSTTTIVGRVLEGCDPKGRGVAGVRIFLEDGTYVVTDKDGMYHFAAVNPGTHVVQLDTITVPERYEPVQCEDNTRFAGRTFSQFVDLQGGSLWRADFHLAPRPPKEKQAGEVGLELRTSLVTTPTVSMTAAPGTVASLSTGESGTFGTLCFGELKVRNSPVTGGAGDTAPGAIGQDGAAYSTMVPLQHANCCLPGVNGCYSVAYAVHLQVGAVPVRNLRLVTMLPDGVAYEGGSSVLNNGGAPDPDVADGVLTYHLGERPAGWEGTLGFRGTLPAQGVEGNLPTKSFLIFDTPTAKGVRTPVADTNLVRYSLQSERNEPDVVFRPTFDTLKAGLSRRDREEIEQIVKQLKARNIEHMTIIGHTDSNVIRWGASKEFPDNYALSRGRATTVANVIAKELNLSPDKISIEGKGPDVPIATNKTAEGRAMNRRVELRVDMQHSSAWTYVRNDKETSGLKAVSVTGLPVGEAWPADQPAGKKDEKADPSYDAAWMDKQQIGVSWLWPNEGYHPSIPSADVAIQYDPSKPFKLFLNGVEVDASYIDNTAARSDNRVAVSLWRGLPLHDGDNLFEAVQYDENAVEISRVKRIMHYSGSPVKAEIIPAKSQLLADGRKAPVIAVLLTDKDGYPAREGVMGGYTVDPPYLPRKRAEDLQKNPLTASANDQLRYRVGEDGIALIELQPTTQTGEVVLHFTLADGISKEVRTWIKPANRDWVLVGLAEGTVGYNVVKGNMETFAAGSGDDKYYDENRLAFYAKGTIKGEWLLTLAYDSNKETNGQSLYQTIDPNKYYTLYGDATMQGNDAASSQRLYVKLERGQFYALFGDYDTGLTVTELSRYSRQLTGVKSEMKSDHFDYTLFASRNDQTFVKDEIPGDGTSGLYHLTRKNIVLNSETVVIETRDRYRSEVILSSQPLSRFLDYSIDYDTGTIFFKSPVFNTDANFNPIFIVVRYETFGGSENSYTYGGRGAVRVLDNKVELGATHIHEEENGGVGALTGVDTTVKVDDHTQIKAEIATSNTNESGSASDGSAYLTELSHRSGKIDGKAYVREQSVGFGLGQQNDSETGTRKVGADLNYLLDKSWSVGGEAYQQTVLGTGAVRDLTELHGHYLSGKFDLLSGARNVEDTLTEGQSYRSEQLFASAKYQFTDRLALRISRDQSVGANDNVDYPTKTAIGADYKLSDTSTFFADQEWTQGSGIDAATSRIGIKAAPWTGGQIGSTMEQQTTENGVRLFSTTGLKQSWQVTKKWSVDAGLDRSQTLRDSTVSADGGVAPYIFNTNVPPAVGLTEDFTAVSLGAGYREEKWSWTGRVEDRVSTSEDKFDVFTGANGEAQKGLGLAAGLQAFKTSAVSGMEQMNGDLRLALAYRPVESRIIFLDRLDYLLNEQHGGGSIEDDSWRVVNNFIANIKTDNRTQVSVQYGAKYVQETIDQNDYRGYTDLSGLEGRYDITKKWDIGLRGLLLHSWSIEQMKYGTGASVGFNPGKNIWVSVGYNFAGFRDRDFSSSDFTSQGPFVKLRIKFDQVSVRDAVKWISGQ